MTQPNNIFIVTGTPSETSWSQAYTYQFGNTTILILISLHKQGVFDLAMYGNKLADDIYQQITSKLPLKINQLKQLIKSFDPQLPELKLNLGIAIIKQNYLQVALSGSLSCFLFRQQPISLLESPSHITGLTGFLTSKDIFFLTTSNLAQLIQPKLALLIKDKQLQDTLNRLIHAQTDSSQLSGIIYTSKSSSPQLNFKLPRLQFPHFKIKSMSPKSTQTNRFIALLLIIFFFLSVGFGFIKRTQLNRASTFEQLQTTLNNNQIQIKQLVSAHPEQALQLFQTSQSLIQGYLQHHANDGYLDKTKQLQQQLQQLQAQLFHYYPVNLDVYLDLNTIFDNELPTHLNLDTQTQSLILTSTHQLTLLNLQDKSTLNSQLNTSIIDSAIWNNQAFILTSIGVDVFSFSTKQLTHAIQSDELNWQQPQFIALYAGNIYLLDPHQSEIWKYPIINTNHYGKSQRWLATGITPDLSKVIDFHIDGHVWFLTSSGKLQAYLHGVPTQFKLQGLVNQLTQPTSFFLTDTEIFILEPTNSRILVFSKKNGNYLRQYLNPNLHHANKIFVNHNHIYVWYDHYLARFKL